MSSSRRRFVLSRLRTTGEPVALTTLAGVAVILAFATAAVVHYVFCERFVVHGATVP